MSLLDYHSQVPGYAEAVNVEQANRDVAFLATTPPICGVPIVHLSLRHWVQLIGCRNRFIRGERPEPSDVAMFLWFLSPDYSTDAAARAKFVAERVRPLEFIDVTREIYVYLNRVFQDIPQGNGGSDGKSYTAPVASMVDLLAHEYGWDDERILSLPLARLFQYLRRIEKRNDPKALQFNRSERLISEWLANRLKPSAPVGTQN
jgi:hypothetical protein